MKHQALFSLKDENEKYKSVVCAILLGALRVNSNYLPCAILMRLCYI